MKINHTYNGNELIIALEGRLDTTSAPELESFILENYKNAGFITLDCEKLEYLSSAGLRVILGIQKKMGGQLKLQKVCELVHEVLEITGFADILTIK